MAELKKGMLVYKYSFHQGGYRTRDTYKIVDVWADDGGRVTKVKADIVLGTITVYLDAKDVGNRIFHSGKMKSVFLAEPDGEKARRMVLSYLKGKMEEYLVKLDGYISLYEAMSKTEGDGDGKLP